MTSKAHDPASDGATMTAGEDMTYGDKLHLETMLSLQDIASDAHDEMLFIIQHQTAELWMKLVVYEMTAARDALKHGDLAGMKKMLSRVSRILEQLNSAWDVLRTMTPADFTRFRDVLGTSSGLQSYQYRMIEFILGNRNPNMLKLHEHLPAVHRMLSDEMARPSFYDEVNLLLFRTIDGDEKNFPAPQLDSPHEAVPEIQARWKIVYENIEQHWGLYEIAEKLVDLEDYFRRWRFNHVTTVERVIGFKRGTGGTSGVQYLRRMLEVELFPELWHLRGEL